MLSYILKLLRSGKSLLIIEGKPSRHPNLLKVRHFVEVFRFHVTPSAYRSAGAARVTSVDLFQS